MQASSSNNNEHARLDRVDRLLRLQNTATQLELLLKKTRDLESSEENEILPLDNTKSIHSISHTS